MITFTAIGTVEMIRMNENVVRMSSLFDGIKTVFTYAAFSIRKGTQQTPKTYSNVHLKRILTSLIETRLGT